MLRLYGIWFPPVETWHSWRQTLTNMMARNLSEGSFSLLYPVIDMGGERSGIIGSEFPFFQALIAGCNTLCGYDHWYGRLINLLVSSVATWCFYHIILRFWNERTARYATIIFLCSLWFSFSRKTMPDTFAVSLVIIGIYFFVNYIASPRLYHWVLGTFFITLGGLCKIPAVYLFTLFLPIWLNKSVFYPLKLKIGAGILIASTIIAWWYFYWVPYLVETYRFQLFFPKGIVEGLNEIRPLWADFWAQIYFGALRSYIALLPIGAGILWLFYRNNRRTAIGFAALFVVFLLFAIKTGTVFPTHNYYVLPLSPVLATLAAIGLQRFQPKWSIVLLLFIGMEGLGNQLSDFRIKPEVKYRLSLEKQVNQFVPKNAKIVIPTGSNPEWMYWYHRKGWSIDSLELTHPETMDTIDKNGGHYFVLDKHVSVLQPPFRLLGETKDLRIFLIK